MTNNVSAHRAATTGGVAQAQLTEHERDWRSGNPLDNPSSFIERWHARDFECAPNGFVWSARWSDPGQQYASGAARDHGKITPRTGRNCCGAANGSQCQQLTEYSHGATLNKQPIVRLVEARHEAILRARYIVSTTAHRVS
jgi:hypothetical protein